jgi:hypothetical protein
MINQSQNVYNQIAGSQLGAFEFSRYQEMKLASRRPDQLNGMLSAPHSVGIGLYPVYGPTLEIHRDSYKEIPRLTELGDQLTSSASRAMILMWTGRSIATWELLPYEDRMYLVTRGYSEEALPAVDPIDPPEAWLAAWDYAVGCAREHGVSASPYRARVVAQLHEQMRQMQQSQVEMLQMYENLRKQGLGASPGVSGISGPFARNLYGANTVVRDPTQIPEQRSDEGWGGGNFFSKLFGR